MVEIPKALSFESKVIIMDESTDALTDTETESLFNVINELREQGCGIVYISHRLKEILRFVTTSPYCVTAYLLVSAAYAIPMKMA